MYKRFGELSMMATTARNIADVVSPILASLRMVLANRNGNRYMFENSFDDLFRRATLGTDFAAGENAV